MRVKLHRRLGQNAAGATVDYDDRTARWITSRGYGTAVGDTARQQPAEEPRQEPGEGPPPQSGKGSGRDAWASYAQAHDVEIEPEASRDDVIAACCEAGVPVD